MVHLRVNEKETNPNTHINFITSLPADPEGQEEARQLLRALAAQVRPVMKSHGFGINSFEEYEYNKVFAGRNWNNGETVELVLRRPDGTFYPIYWLMSTLCHELAHIKHMNHGPAFQALWSRLRAEVRHLQDRGYYGDGYWSAGTRLRDATRVGGMGIEEGDFPEYMCGGAQARQRPTATRRRRGPQGKRREVVPSLHTGAQTTKKRKAGGRVTSKYAFVGEGTALAEDGKGTGFGKKAASKRAREERAIAAERRLMALQGISQDTKPSTSSGVESTADEEFTDDDEVEIIHETDIERRQALLDSENDANPQEKIISSNSWKLFKDEFNFEGSSRGAKASGSGTTQPTGDDVIEISSGSEDEDERVACDTSGAPGPTFTSGVSIQTGSSRNGKERATGIDNAAPSSYKQPVVPLGLGKMVKSEIDHRKKEALGMAPVKGGGRTLGSKSVAQKNKNKTSHDIWENWSCLVCTLENESGRLSCSACATRRGQLTWSENV